MRGYFDPFGMMLQSLLTLVPIFIIIAVMIGSGTITVERPYYEELQQCELDLKNTQPICPTVECKSDNLFIYWFSGMFFGAIMMYAFFKGKEKEKSSQSKSSTSKK